jgi:hypothetical protein
MQEVFDALSLCTCMCKGGQMRSHLDIRSYKWHSCTRVHTLPHRMRFVVHSVPINACVPEHSAEFTVNFVAALLRYDKLDRACLVKPSGVLHDCLT